MADDGTGLPSSIFRSKFIFDAVSGHGCLCHVDAGCSTELAEVFTSDKWKVLCQQLISKPQVTTVKCFDEILLLCGFLDKFCILHSRLINSNHFCSDVKKIVDILVSVRIEVKECLIQLLLRRERFINYAACKALVSFLSLITRTTGSACFIKDVDISFSKKLLEINTDETTGMLTVIELFCTRMAEVKLPMESVFDNWFYTINDCSYCLMAKIVSSSGKGSWQPHNSDCLARVLRILVNFTSSTRYLQGFFVNYPVLLQLLLISPPFLLDGLCQILHKVMKSLPKLDDATCTQSVQMKITSDVLNMLIALLDDFTVQKDELFQLRGFGGTFSLQLKNSACVSMLYFIASEAADFAFEKQGILLLYEVLPESVHYKIWNHTNWKLIGNFLVLSCSEFQKEEQLIHQSIILLYLSSLAFASKDCLPTNDELHLLKRSIVALRTFYEKKTSTILKTSPSLQFSIYLVSLFDDQDDALVEALVYSLEIEEQLISIKFDYNVILDFLMSTDTSFLFYIVKYLKLASTDSENVIKTHRELSQHLSCENLNTGKSENFWNWMQPAERKFCDKQTSLVDYEMSEDDDDDDHGSGSSASFVKETLVQEPANVFNLELLPSLEQVVEVCNLLSVSIEKKLNKNLFPYNAKPLLSLLKTFLLLYKDECTGVV